MQRYLDVEAAIARVQGRLKIIPQEVADEVAAKCTIDSIDIAKLGARTSVVGFPIVGLVEQLVAACKGGLGEYAHWGATTQDIMDTADILQIRDALKVIERDLDAVAERLAVVAADHRDTVMPGRTHIQHALPVTFGYKAAVWLSALDRHRRRFAEVKPRLLVGQFAGGVGSLASLGKRGLEMQDALMDELGLGRPDITWHTARDNISEITGLLALMTGSLAKMGLDIILMSTSETDEVREPFLKGRGSSSTMPQKRNPVVSEMLIVASKTVRQLHGSMLDAMVHDHERGAAGPWQTEWHALPEIFIITAAALKHARELVDGLEINAAKMSANLGVTEGLIMAEAVMMGLADRLGRQKVHDIVYECCRTVVGERINFLDALLRHEEIRAVTSRDELAQLIDPARYIGVLPEMIDRYLGTRHGRSVP